MSYKSSNFRRGQNSVGAPAEKGNPKVQQLQEMFPSWSDDDLKSVLTEVNFDIELAVTRISEGHAEQWGSVARKKEKRTAPGTAHGRDAHGGDRERADSRGARGGRGGGRGGRGGGRGTGRGGHRETNGRHAPSPAPPADSLATGSRSQNAPATEDAASSEPWGGVNGSASGAATSAWADAGDASASTSVPTVESTPTAKRGNGDATVSVRENGATASTTEPKPQDPEPVHVSATKPLLKTPATSKLSWAQIAKPQEKPKVVPSPALAPPPLAPPSAAVPEPVEAPLETEQETQPDTPGWEEPTTAQAPTWDDEPQPQAALPAASDGWITSAADVVEIKPEPVVEEVPPPAQPEPEPEPISVPSAFPVQLGLHQKAETTIVPPVKPATPVSYARSLTRSVNRFKTSDQAVVMPSTFGSSVEKLGMQFGSVNIGGDDVSDIKTSEPASPEVTSAVQTAPEPTQEVQVQPSPVPEPTVAAPVPSAPQSSITSTHTLFQQTLPQQAQQVQQSQVHSSLHTAQPTSSLLSTQVPTQVSQVTTSTASSTPLTSFSTQQATPSSQSSVSPYQQHSSQHTQPQTQTTQAQAQIQPQSQLHQQFSHFPSHLDPTANQQSPPQSQQSAVHQGISSHGSYFRQPEQNYFHTPTPPAGQAQDAPYGSFAPLSQQLGHQTQGSHLSGFSSDHFGYNDGSRGFYDSYGQQSSFGGRNALGHDDIGKTLPGAQQATQTSSVLPAPTSQTAQQQTSQQPQGAGQPQGPTAGQPQQGYAPVPYYYNPYHQPNQFYGPPYTSGYGLNQYANRYQPQQPPMFQPPNPTSASPANAKGPSTVQPQSNPYAQGLYGQQHASSAYDDGYSHHNQLGHSQGVNALPSNDYTKQLYGGQGIQSFMGVGQSTGPNAPLGQRGATGGGSPENAYKPYGPGVGAKDVGGAPGVGSSIAGGQGGLGQASRASVQQPQHSQGFYGANRFSANPTAGGPPSQQAQQQQNQGYPQGGADNSFYYQRGPSQQQPYWQ